MSDGKDKKENEKKEADSSNNQEQSSAAKEEKKLKKNIRFQLPEYIRSEESFVSALSSNLADVSIDDVDEQSYKDFTPSSSSISLLKKYVLSPLHHTSPRSAKTNFKFEAFLEDDIKSTPLASCSSRQLFEISRDSPTPSEADINLINATYLRKLGAVKEAINNGADVNTYRDRQTSLLIASEIGDSRLVAYLITVPNINPDFQNDFGQTPLAVAVRNAFDRIVRLLLIHKADVNLADYMGRTPLHCAIFQKRVGLVKLLLSHGADYEKPDCFEERPMFTAAVKRPHLECLLTLLKIGASPEYRNITGIPLLSRTILHGRDITIVEALVFYGASVNSQDTISGKTPLHYAAQTNNIEAAKLLFSEGADVNIKTIYDFNPYEEALFHGSIEVIDFLENKTQNLKVKTFASIKLETAFERNKDMYSLKESTRKKKKKRKRK